MLALLLAQALFGGTAGITFGGDTPGAAHAPGKDLLVSAELGYEWRWALVALEGGATRLTGDNPANPFVAARLGLVAPWRFAPFVALGAGYMSQSWEPSVYAQGFQDPVTGAGLTILGEAGLDLWRGSRTGRVQLAARFFAPQFDLQNAPPRTRGAYSFALSLRLLFAS